jgi:hypothetical protein
MTPNTNNPAGNYASVNGITLYYEIHGFSQPFQREVAPDRAADQRSGLPISQW